MTDEYYEKKRLEEMRKQTECMLAMIKLFADIRDVNRSIFIALSLLDDSVIDKVSDRAVKHADKELRKISDALKERWSE